MTDITNLDDLEHMLKAAARVANPSIAQSDRELVKVSCLLSIARSLESTRVPDQWEALESPSGAILGWFDPQVARTIAQALAASQGQAEPESLPVVVGSVVVLTEALELAGDDPDAVGALTMGEVLDLGRTEDEPYALVKWDDTDAEPGKVWVSALTALEVRDGEPVGVSDGHDPDKVNHYYDDGLGDPETCTDEGHNHPEPSAPIEVATLDGGGGAVSGVTLDDEAVLLAGVDLEPEGDIEVEGDDIDADFDTVVEAEPAAPVDGLSALKGKSKGKR